MNNELRIMNYGTKRRAFVISVFVFSIILTSYFIIPSTASAQFQIVPECLNAQGKPGPCGWVDFVKLLDNFLKFSVIIAVPIAAALFAWAGFLYLTARGNPGQITKASSIFLSVVIGFVVVLSAWLIIDFILKELSSVDGYIRILE